MRDPEIRAFERRDLEEPGKEESRARRGLEILAAGAGNPVEKLAEPKRKGLWRREARTPGTAARSDGCESGSLQSNRRRPREPRKSALWWDPGPEPRARRVPGPRAKARTRVWAPPRGRRESPLPRGRRRSVAASRARPPPPALRTPHTTVRSLPAPGPGRDGRGFPVPAPAGAALPLPDEAAANRSSRKFRRGSVNSLWWNPGERRERGGARLTRRVREEYRVYFDRNATQSAAKRRGSAGMHRRSNAA